MPRTDPEDVILETSWNVKRFGRIDEVDVGNGNIRFRVKIWDAGRNAFLTQWFNDIAPASDFLEGIKEENLEASRKR